MKSLLRGAALFLLSPLVMVALFFAINYGAQGEVVDSLLCLVGTMVAAALWAGAKAGEWNAGWRHAKTGGRLR